MTTLNPVELAMMQSPVRAWSQRHLEMRLFRRLLRQAGRDLTGARLLDAGCGNGHGLQLIQETFQPRRLVGFDLMPAQIERAQQRGLAAEIRVGDITQIDEPDGSFDGVFVFGILHHVPAWRQALRELARVLVPGGVLLVEELHGRYIAIQDRVLRTSHPKQARFDWPQFREGLADAGFTVRADASLGFVRSFCATRA
ncbi:MAG TPA: class I SAM-dependent methyltransferase [Kofleriaceae bacterium]|nr:class I SAM-dependent methyltransferase [Kofleriaceae bacterium]